jgi:glutathione S-transferase
LVLAEKGISYDKINVHEEGFNRQDPSFVKASPRGKVPAIIDGETYLSEAYDINSFLEKKYPQPRLLPQDEKQRDAIKDWVKIYDKKLCLKIGLLLIECLLKPKDKQKEEVKVRLRGEIHEGLKSLNEKLDGNDYLFGEYSLADVSMTPHVAALGRVNLEIPQEFNNVKAWMERIKARPNFAASAG